MIKPREELNILEDLTNLTASPGYAHAIAYFSHRDYAVYSKEEFQPDDLDKFYSPDRLIRTELTTLIGLMVKQPLDLSLPSPEVILDYVARTEVLMEELHAAINSPAVISMVEVMETGEEPASPWQGLGMREPIFYGAESAYTFQYCDFIPEKYGADDDWLKNNKGFTSVQAKVIAISMGNLLGLKLTKVLAKARSENQVPDTWLPAFELRVEEVAYLCDIEHDVVQAFFNAFLFKGDNSAFKEVGDFNAVAAWPLLPTDRGTVLLFVSYSLYESLYESPFFWMWDDKAYRQESLTNRGEFTEKFAARRLENVFGKQHVYTNITLKRGKDVVEEADVLVIYADRVIIVQAKAKKLTIEARKGNDSQLKSDFAAAIQDSYDQGIGCAKKLLTGECRLINQAGSEVTLPDNIKEIFIINLISEHYPALAFQANQSLKFETTDIIRAPFVMDVFLLDTMTEFLSTPLRLLSYIKQRVFLSDKLMSGHELTVLAYHLKLNLWVSDEYNLVLLDDSIARDLDAAMIVRRTGQAGADTPEGILTRMRGTRYEGLMQEIENKADPRILELGFNLLTMDEHTCNNVHSALESLIRQTRIDGKRHDVTIGSLEPIACGICLHCNPSVTSESMMVLRRHCEKRKYKLRADKWFGLSIDIDGHIQFGVTLEYPWEHSDLRDEQVAGMKELGDGRAAFAQFLKEGLPRKYGRNEPCFCGSGRKYKRCCLV